MGLPDFDNNDKLEGSQASRQAVQNHKALALNKETKPLEENNDDDKSDITEVTENKTPRKKKIPISQ
eukprot:6662219-Ditylum_brightwellii.AAC.1